MAKWPNHAGLIGYARARSTRTHVGIYLNVEAQICEGDDNPYSTVCEEHGGIVSHPNVSTAREWAPHPEEWCPDCQATWPS